MNELETLYGIQQLDIRIHNLGESEEKHPLKADIERFEEELQADREELDKALQVLAESKAKQEKQEGEVQRMDEKLGREEGKLYGGTVGNPKELRGLQAEVRALKKQKDMLETEILEEMERLDDISGKVDELKGRVDEKQAALDGERSTLDQEVAAIRQESAQLQEEKQGLRQQVSEEVLEIYDALLASKHNLAVVKVVEGVCTGCRVELPGKEYDRFLKSEAVFRCSNCRRILVK